MKVTPKKEETGSMIKGCQEGPGRERMEAPSPIHHPSPAKEPLPGREEVKKQVEEVENRVKEARQLEDVARSLSSLLTQQLAQMAAEAGPATSGQEELARRML